MQPLVSAYWWLLLVPLLHHATNKTRVLYSGNIGVMLSRLRTIPNPAGIPSPTPSVVVGLLQHVVPASQLTGSASVLQHIWSLLSNSQSRAISPEASDACKSDSIPCIQPRINFLASHTTSALP
ncbi:hypothetical protein EDD15DRAFT_2203749 [Pisolithus albus]|nr:hypothetical protein EDD15DRAFT_2205227 [Pisolithus albus]KAI5981646.1 hypothetical protein EDD15DRAFT_2203749 [Pisolithus albus]